MPRSIHHVLPSFLLIASLSACGGGGDGGLRIISDGAPAAPADYVGKTFPVLFFGGIANGPVLNAVRSQGTIEIVSLTEVILNYSGNSVTLTDPDMNGVFDSIDASLQLTENSSDMRNFEFDTVDGDGFLGFFGFETDPADLASVSTGSYLGIDSSFMVLANSSGEIVEARQGNAALSVNFGSGGVSGAVFDYGDVVLSLVNGTVGNSGLITGQLSMTSDMGGPIIPIDVVNTDVDARIFGADAERLGGTYEGDFVTPYSGATSFVGGFTAEEFVP